MKKNILIACEESQTVCKAFRERGFNAFSCDITRKVKQIGISLEGKNDKKTEAKLSHA